MGLRHHLDSTPPREARAAAAADVELVHLQLMHNPDGRPHLLCAGEFGKVYKARYLREPCAVKVFIFEEKAKGEADFRKEIWLLRRCSHPNVVAFKGACTTAPGYLLLVMELLHDDLRSALDSDSQGDLRWHCKPAAPGGPHQLGKGRSIALGIAKGLAFLHSQHVVHLDLKSPNVLLTSDWDAKIGDIGLARLVNNDYLSAQVAIGSFAWTAPEVLMGGKCSDKVDVYSFGIILWELITGEAPFRGRMRSPRVPEECSQGVADLLQACRHEVYGQRPSAADIVKQLEGSTVDLDARRVTSWSRVPSTPLDLPVVAGTALERCCQQHDAVEAARVVVHPTSVADASTAHGGQDYRKRERQR